jgi:hypothetical protein
MLPLKAVPAECLVEPLLAWLVQAQVPIREVDCVGYQGISARDDDSAYRWKGRLCAQCSLPLGAMPNLLLEPPLARDLLHDLVA